MSEILISYRDSGGVEQERHISDIRIESPAIIDAYCHVRQARRSFRIDRISHAIDCDTGEVVNPWKIANNGTGPENRETLESLTWRALPAIKALKFFTDTTRKGGCRREIERLVQFVQEVADVTSHSNDELYEWVKKLPCGQVYDYRTGNHSDCTDLLKKIPSSLLGRCRHYALLIAKGSGRKPVDQEWLERIETEFSPEPRVKMPELIK